MKKYLKILLLVPILVFVMCQLSVSTFAEKSGLFKEGLYYYFNNNGKIVTNDFVKIGNDYYFFDEEGRMVINSFKRINDDYYYFDKEGKRYSGWMNYNSSFSHLKQYNGKHYFRSDGRMMYDSLLKSGNKYYGFDIHGVQYVNRFGMVKGKVYKFDQNGYKVDYELLTVDSVLTFMNEGYEWLSLPSGECQLVWYLSKGDKEDDPYDYCIYANVAPRDWQDKSYKTKSVLSNLIYEMGKPKYSESDRDKANKTLQKYITTAAKGILKVKPNAKVESYYYESWHKYAETWRVYSNDFYSQMWLTCRNYDVDYNHMYDSNYNAYKETKKGKLHWIASSSPCTKNH